MFKTYLAAMSTIAKIATEEHFVAIQQIQSDILNSYTAGDLSDFEKRTLYNVSAILIEKIRKELYTHKERSK